MSNAGTPIPGVETGDYSCNYTGEYGQEKAIVCQDNGGFIPVNDEKENLTPVRKSHRVKGVSQPNEKDKNDGALAVICQWIVSHQIGLTANLLLLLALTHLCFPRARRHTRKFFQLSYYNTSSEKYTIGWDDVFLVFYWIILFTGLRAAVMDYGLVPIAQMAGIRKKKEIVRFAEQAWVFIYSIAFWSLGMYLLYNSGYWFNFRELWVGWPIRELDALMKWYYLVQFAFWLQQMLVVNIEERRKDYHQMFTHHIITSVLIFTSYGYHFTKVGNTILCLMDVADVFLPFAKILKYLHFQTACDIAFGIFMLVWVVARHYLYLAVCYSLYTESHKEITYGCYWGPNSDLHGPINPPDHFNHLIQPFRDPEGLVCWNNNIKWAFMFTLLALQVILLVWFAMIVRVALKVLRGGEAEDSRSDDEDESEDETIHTRDSKIYKNSRVVQVPPIEEEVGVEGINLTNSRKSPTRRSRKGVGVASGVTIHSDRKELLGRIGCDKGS